MMKVAILACPACGAPLEVAPEDEQFACAYCGATLGVVRGGGKVALKELEMRVDDVERVAKKADERSKAALRLPEAMAKRDAAKQNYQKALGLAVSFLFMFVALVVSAVAGLKVPTVFTVVFFIIGIVSAVIAAPLKHEFQKAKEYVDRLEHGETG